MKKINFLLIILLSLILVGCSQVDDNEFQPEIPTNGKLYKMSFNVSQFGMESTPVSRQAKAAKELKGNFLQYIIYKEDGSFLQAKTLNNEELMEMNDATDSSLKFDVELPIGKYVITALTGTSYELVYPMPSFPENFATDYSSGNQWVAYDSGNKDIYYESTSFEISENSNDNIASMTLKPMWSTLTIQVINADVCDFPTNTAYVTYSLSPAPGGFYLKSKEPKYYPYSSGSTSFSFLNTVLNIEAFKLGGNINFITDKIKDATIKIQFYSQNLPQEDGVLLREHIIYKGDIERGKNIVLKGKLPESSSEQGNDSSIQFNYVDMENVEIPFTE